MSSSSQVLQINRCTDVVMCVLTTNVNTILTLKLGKETLERSGRGGAGSDEANVYDAFYKRVICDYSAQLRRAFRLRLESQGSLVMVIVTNFPTLYHYNVHVHIPSQRACKGHVIIHRNLRATLGNV